MQKKNEEINLIKTAESIDTVTHTHTHTCSFKRERNAKNAFNFDIKNKSKI